MLYLLEAPVGIALLQNADSIALVDKLVYKSTQAAIRTAEALNSLDELPEDVDAFLRANLKGGCVLNVLSPALAAEFTRRYAVNATCAPDDVFRRLRVNPFKWFGINRDVYNAIALRIAHRAVGCDQKDIQLIETLNTIDELERGINNRTMRIREWYALHFPELNQINDNVEYLRLLLLIGNRTEYMAALTNGTDEDADTAVPENIREMLVQSMGVEISEYDIAKIKANAQSILDDVEYRKRLFGFLKETCSKAFPNMYALVGEIVSAKLIRKAGSLSRLAQCVSSTIQIMGAEKSFNEAIKSKGNTPKYGLIYECKPVARASAQNSGRIARVLANKIALCARVDLASESLDGSFGTKAKHAVDALFRKLDERNKVEKPVKQQKKKVISVQEYDQLKDSIKKVKKE